MLNNFLNSETGNSFKDAEIFAVSDCVGGLLMYEALAKINTVESNTQLKGHRPVARNFSSISVQCSSRDQYKDKNVKFIL